MEDQSTMADGESVGLRRNVEYLNVLDSTPFLVQKRKSLLKWGWFQEEPGSFILVHVTKVYILNWNPIH